VNNFNDKVQTIDLNVRNNTSEDVQIHDKFVLKLQPTKTAIILIDVWNRHFLTKLVLERLNPLLKLLREYGIQIIHAPSQGYGNIHPDLIIDDEDFLVTGFDDIFYELKVQGINTILYAGFDTMLCVMDKPLGVINQYNKNELDCRHIIIRDAVYSSFEETQSLGIHIYEGFIFSTSIKEIFNANSTNYLKHNDYDYPAFKFKENSYNRKIFSQGLLVVLFKDSVTQDNQKAIENIEKWAETNSLLNINFSIDSQKALCSSGLSLKTEKDFIKYIRNKNIKNIIYAGDSLDGEILHSSLGLVRLYIQRRYKENPMPNVFVLSDYSFFSRRAINSNDDILKKTLLSTNRWFTSITFFQLCKLLRNKNPNKLEIFLWLAENLYHRILRRLSLKNN